MFLWLDLWSNACGLCLWLAQKKKHLSRLKKSCWTVKRCDQMCQLTADAQHALGIGKQEKTEDVLVKLVEDEGFHKVLPIELHTCSC